MTRSTVDKGTTRNSPKLTISDRPSTTAILLFLHLVAVALFTHDARAQTLVQRFGSPGTGDGEFGSVTGISVDLEGRVYVADAGNSRVQVFDSDGTFVFKLAPSSFNWSSPIPSRWKTRPTHTNLPSSIDTNAAQGRRSEPDGSPDPGGPR